MYIIFLSKILGIHLNTHAYTWGPPLDACTLWIHGGRLVWPSRTVVMDKRYGRSRDRKRDGLETRRRAPVVGCRWSSSKIASTAS
jgi:hypothetical protein